MRPYHPPPSPCVATETPHPKTKTLYNISCIILLCVIDISCLCALFKIGLHPILSRESCGEISPFLYPFLDLTRIMFHLAIHFFLRFLLLTV